MAFPEVATALPRPMSDTTEQAAVQARQDSPTLDAVRRHLQRHVDDDEAGLVVRFADIFFSKAPADVLRERSVDALAHMTLGAFRFLQRSRPDRVDVEMFNPDVDNEGWYAPVSVVRTNISERPFIIDTLREYLHAADLTIEHIIYPVLDVHRDETGRVVGFDPSETGGERESLVHCEVLQVADRDERSAIASEVSRRLQDVVRATDDFDPMIDALNNVVVELAERGKALPAHRDEMEEVEAFLRWLRDEGFVFLGYRGYDLVGGEGGSGKSIVVEPGSGLGILRKEAESTFADPVPVSELKGSIRALVEGGPLLIISKTNAESTVHRRARMDYIGVKKLTPEGEISGEHRFVGLFTSKAYQEDAENIPILRRKLHQILEGTGVRKGSHDYKATITIFNSLPKEELFVASAEEVGEDVRTVLMSYHTSGVRVSVREDPLQRGASVMVILPRDRFSGRVRRGIESVLVETFGGEVLNYHLAMGEGDQARMHFFMEASPEVLDAVDTTDIEHAVERLIRTWADRIRDGLERVRPPAAARRMAREYGDALSAEYQAATEPEVAVADVLELEAMRGDGRNVSISLANRGESVAAPGVPDVTEMKVFLRGERLILSDFMPILEHAGLRVIAVNPFDVRGGNGGSATIYAFAVQDSAGRPLDVEGRGALLAEAILAVRSGDALNDDLNRLVLSAGLHWREVDVLRGYVGYAFQLRAVPSRASLPSALVKYPGIAKELCDLFQTLFDPSAPGEPAERLKTAEDIRTLIQGSLRSVTLLGDDRALRCLEALISATLRTNYYRHGGRNPIRRSGGVPYISYKFSCAALSSVSRSRLRYEVWVHSARMEGVHLRGSDVARGGIRWSDRPDDFRTEILGLVNTQVVKNAVIVPGGSKGGFVPRRLPSDPEARYEEGKEQYRTLMRGLLDVTDNLGPGGETIRPEAVICYDDPDPYLVVAADKGTAAFSDVANAISAEYGFWLGDAFASGGSHGYDHKAVGITARGAWECVKRHFREMGKDIQSEPFTVVGIGDMSGDVFGNGMLLSRRIRLLAAFDHRHVFIDPDPDPEASFNERKRVFELGRSSWEDYDRSVMSAGSMLVPRGAKEVELTPEARAALGVPDDVGALDGEALIRAVLAAPVELLWNGGIGTYVKSGSETHADAGDPSNDAVRVDVADLRCRVVGEGGNLGFTQAARIEYALAGGRINTDALDNSAGVDMSDHEVNLKILLNPLVAAEEMTEVRRNELLEELTEDVARLVLEDNRTQSLAVSLDAIRAREAGDEFRDLIHTLERSGRLDRAAEHLPSLDTMLERRERGESLARPELCVLLAYAKLFLKGGVLRGSLADDPVTESYLLGYFPPAAIVAVGHERLLGHRLRREIIATQVTNDLVDLMGATFVNRVCRDMGRSADEVAMAWLVASRLAGRRSILRQMSEQQSAVDAPVAHRWLLGLARVLERTTRWVLQNVDPETSPARIIDENVEGLATLRDGFAQVVAGEERELFETRVEEIRELGASGEFSRNLITLRFLDQLLEILQIARATESSVVASGRAFYRVSEAFEIPWLRRAVFSAAGDDHWEQRAAQVLSEDVSRAHQKLVTAAMKRIAGNDDVESAVRDTLSLRPRAVARFRDILEELKAEDAPTGLAGASVAVRELSALANRV